MNEYKVVYSTHHIYKEYALTNIRIVEAKNANDAVIMVSEGVYNFKLIDISRL